jgi:predicted small lipoprotein YifL
MRRIALILLFCVLLPAVYACGQKGPLYLPEEPAEQERDDEKKK